MKKMRNEKWKMKNLRSYGNPYIKYNHRGVLSNLQNGNEAIN